MGGPNLAQAGAVLGPLSWPRPRLRPGRGGAAAHAGREPLFGLRPNKQRRIRFPFLFFRSHFEYVFDEYVYLEFIFCKLMHQCVLFLE